jgi:methylenetetrahydrofolate reductase (NADPH)
MGLKEALESKKFIITSEIGPPKGTSIEKMLDEAVKIKGKVDAVNVTDLQSSVMRVGSMAMCRLLFERGLEPIFQLTCRDRNRLALQSDLLSASILGIKNVLALTGDHPLLGDHPQAKPVYDLDSVQLVQVIKKLNSGYDMNGNKLNGSTDFFIGAVVNPGADEIEPEIIKFKKKVAAGAQFFQTQAIFDVEVFKKFMSLIKDIEVPVLGGIVLLKSAAMARYMNKNVAGIYVSDDLIEEMEQAEDRKEKSIDIAARLIEDIKPYCAGVHIMPIGWENLILRVLEKADLFDK